MHSIMYSGMVHSSVMLRVISCIWNYFRDGNSAVTSGHFVRTKNSVKDCASVVSSSQWLVIFKKQFQSSVPSKGQLWSKECFKSWELWSLRSLKEILTGSKRERGGNATYTRKRWGLESHKGFTMTPLKGVQSAQVWLQHSLGTQRAYWQGDI